MSSRSPINNLNCSRIAALLVVVLTAIVSRAPAADIARAAAELRSTYAGDIEELARWCEKNGLSIEAKKTRHTLGPSDPCKLYVPILPEMIGPPKLPENASAKAVEWDGRLIRLRRDHAMALYEMARQAVRTGRAGLAFELAIASLQADPDYEPARRLFGYQKFREQWHTAYEVKKLRAGQVWSERFGWLPKAHLRRYEEGQRYNDGRWISAKEDAERHRDIRSGWTLETEHYMIHTDHSIEAGAALAVKLERLNRLWRQMFVRYYASETDVMAMFDGRPKLQAAPLQHNVMYFRDRKDYEETLRASLPNIETAGIYLERPRCAFFFADKEADDRTLYHEATHQLFHESRPIAPDVGRRANFWIIEGIAMYMESLRQEDGFSVLGGFDDQRLHAAQYRLLVDKFFVPFDEFTAFGMEKLQTDPRIATLYSQAAGMTHFLVYFDGGRYRDALVSYLAAVYSGRDNLDTLSTLCKTSYRELDKQYYAFIKSGKSSLEKTAK